MMLQLSHHWWAKSEIVYAHQPQLLVINTASSFPLNINCSQPGSVELNGKGRNLLYLRKVFPGVSATMYLPHGSMKDNLNLFHLRGPHWNVRCRGKGLPASFIGHIPNVQGIRWTFQNQPSQRNQGDRKWKHVSEIQWAHLGVTNTLLGEDFVWRVTVLM